MNHQHHQGHSRLSKTTPTNDSAIGTGIGMGLGLGMGIEMGLGWENGKRKTSHGIGLWGIEAGQDVSQARQLHMQIAGHKPQNWSLAAN